MSVFILIYTGQIDTLRLKSMLVSLSLCLMVILDKLVLQCVPTKMRFLLNVIHNLIHKVVNNVIIVVHNVVHYVIHNHNVINVVSNFNTIRTLSSALHITETKNNCLDRCCSY